MRRVPRTPVRREPWSLRRTGIATLLAAGLLTLPAHADDSNLCTGAAGETALKVSVSGMHSDAGNLTITVYPDDSQRFLAKGGKLFKVRVPIQLPVTTTCIRVPAPAFYALSVYHDADNDHHLKRNLIGLPKEAYGFSNNPHLTVGPPSLDDARFQAGSGSTPVEIHLIH